MADANAPASPLSDFVRRMKRTTALRGVEVLPGAPEMARQTAPGRVVLYPVTGTWQNPADKTVSTVDDDQQFIAEIWGKGSSRAADAAEATFADWDATWATLTRFMQALDEQAANAANPSDPGYFYELVVGPKWNTATDTMQQGTSVEVLFKLRFAIPAASTYEGHVGDNWSQGTVETVEVTAPPFAPAPPAP